MAEPNVTDTYLGNARRTLLCSVSDCGMIANRVGQGLCEKHYMRQRRKGHTGKVVRPDAVPHSSGYVLQAAQGHPMALGGYRAYQHRVVYYDANGEGPFRCHWCDCTVTWDTLHIDHLDDNKTNNQLSNLAASCAVCNQSRGKHKIIEYWRERNGITINGETLTINEWSGRYLIASSTIKARIGKGWTAEAAITTPRGVTGPKTRRGYRVFGALRP